MPRGGEEVKEETSLTASADLWERVKCGPSARMSVLIVFEYQFHGPMSLPPSCADLDIEIENCLNDAAIPLLARTKSLARGLTRPVAEWACHLYMMPIYTSSVADQNFNNSEPSMGFIWPGRPASKAGRR